MFTRISLALFVLSTMYFPSQPLPNPEPSLPTAVVWSPSTGKQAHIPIQQQHSVLQNGQHLAVYEADVPSAVLASLVDSKQKWDSSLSVKVTIWMYYDEFSYQNDTYVSISKYETKWQRYDSSVSMSNASMNAGCMGDSWDGPAEECLPENYANKSIGTPTSGTIYRLNPSWAGHYIYIGYQAGNSRVQLKRGPTTTWWLEICIWKGSCGIDV